MNWTDGELMAYTDGELEPAARSEIERAMAGEASLRERVAALQTQRDSVRAAFAPVLDEAMPARLSALLAAPVAAVVDLDAARATRSPRRPVAMSWAQWGGIAASVLLGVLIGINIVPREAADAAPIAQQQDGRLVAGAAVAQALSTQLASEPTTGSSVAVQLSFVDKDGRYCRTFTSAAMAGLACRHGETWIVQTVVAAEPTAPGVMRQAASALPRMLLGAVDERIDGAALDAGAERQARDGGWRR